MSMVNSPVINPVTLSVYPGLTANVPDIQPFTQRSGATFLRSLEDIIAYMQGPLNDQINALADNNSGTLVAVSQALAAQNTSIQSQLQTILQQIIAGENVNLNDGSILAAVQSLNSVTLAYLQTQFSPASQEATVAQTAQYVAFLNTWYAPAPQGNGADDTTALLTAINAAAQTAGTCILHPGLYTANLDIFNSFNQPLIKGAGVFYTKIQGKVNTVPVVKFNGGSGDIAFGGLRDVSLLPAVGGGGIALCYSGCGGVNSKSVRIEGDANNNPFDEGVRFWNERTGDFTEFDTFEGDILAARQPVYYKVSNSIESFHGSGLVGNTVINCAASVAQGPAILIDDPGLVYNAPLYVHWFKSSSTQYLIQCNNNTAGRHQTMYGQITIEGDGGDNAGVLAKIAVPGGVPNNMKILFEGGIHWFSGQNSTLGALFQVRKTVHDGSTNTVGVVYEPISGRAALKNTPTVACQTDILGAGFGIVTVSIIGPNYHYAAMYSAWQSPYDGSTVLSLISNPTNIDTASVGAPTITSAANSNGIYIANPNYTSAFMAYVQVSPMGNPSINHLDQAVYG